MPPKNSTLSVEEILARARPNIRRLTPYSSARSGATAQELQNNILLNANENPYAPTLQPQVTQPNYYPEPQPQALLQGLSQVYGVPSQQIVLGRGSDEGIDLLIRAFCAEGDAIAICGPTFGMYRCYAEIQGAQVIDIPLQIELAGPKLGNEYRAQLVVARLAMPQLRQLFQKKQVDSSSLKLLFIPSPLAPLGSLIPSVQLIELLQLCAQNRTILVVDEAYAEFATALEPEGYQSMIAHLNEFPNLVVLRTMSKAYGLAGERIGTLLGHPQIVSMLRAAQSPYPLSSSSSSYATALLNDKKALKNSKESIQKLAQQQHRLFAFLQSLPYVQKIYQSAANFIMLQLSVQDCRGVIQLCQEHGFILRDFSRDLKGGIRISIGKAEQMNALMELLQNYQNEQQDKQPI